MNVAIESRLILLTHQYPYAQGDAFFLSRQIESLAARFDEVAIINYRDLQSVELFPLPANCVYYGSVKFGIFRSVFRSFYFLKGRSVLCRQAQTVGSFLEKLRELRAALIGMSIAGDPLMRFLASDQKRGVRTAVFSFWGREMGYSIPWLSQVFRATAVALHGYDLYEERNGRIPLQAEVLKSANLVLPISIHGRQYILNKYPELSRQKVRVRRLGVERSPASSAVFANDAIEIVSCSYAVEVKRIGRILEAVEELARRRGKVVWTHFGGGPLLDEIQNRAELAVAQTPDLTINLPGHTENSSVIAHYVEHKVSLFVNLSSSEGVPVSIMEAISCGVPTVATNVGGVGEIVGLSHGTGILVDADPRLQDVVDAMERVLDAPKGKFDPIAYWEKNFDARANSRILADDLYELLE